MDCSEASEAVRALLDSRESLTLEKVELFILSGLFMPTSACVPLSTVHDGLVGRAGVPISASLRKLEIGNRGSTPSPPPTHLNKPAPA